MEYNCIYCSVSFKRNCDLTKHNKTLKCRENKKRSTEDVEKKDRISILEKELEMYKNKNNELKKEIEEKNLELKLTQNKYEELRKFVEKSSTVSNTFKIKEDIVKDNMFQIDINVNNKQLNKIKYKDIPENVIKKDINSLKLKDNYQLEYSEDDGYINITHLCKAGGKHFKNWNQNEKTKRFLDVLSLSAGIPANEIIKYDSGSNSERSTWAHPQVAINIAQWISPEFDVLVSKWVYEIMLTGKVDIRDNKTTQELDIINKENKLLKNRIKLLESKVLQKQPREKFDENKNVVYIVTTEFKCANGHYKIGKAQELQKRLSTLNTSDKHEVIYNTSCKTKKNMDLLEQIVHNRLENKRIEPNKEWFESEEDGEDFIKLIEECKKIVDY